MFVVCMKTWRDLRVKQLRQSLTIDQRPDTCQLILTNCRNNCFQKITLRLNIAFHILKTQDCITLIHCYKRQTIWFHCVNVYSLSMSISDVDFLHLSYQAKFKRKQLHYEYLCWQGVEIKLFWGVFCIDVELCSLFKILLWTWDVKQRWKSCYFTLFCV
jgi:hypothetical protein